MIAGAHKIVPLATREMEELFSQNCKLVDLLREDMRVMRQQEISMRSVKEVLISRLEELLDKGKMAMENPREVEDNHGICSDVLPELEASYEGILEETFMLAVSVLGKLTELEICNNGAEDSLEGTITSWKDVFQSYTMNLKLSHICDASEKLCIRVVCSFTSHTLCFLICITLGYTI
jgi:midasin